MKYKVLLSLIISLVFSISSYAQNQLSGTVSDVTGETLIGASILVKGTQIGTVTDFDGNYSLTVPVSYTHLTLPTILLV